MEFERLGLLKQLRERCYVREYPKQISRIKIQFRGISVKSEVRTARISQLSVVGRHLLPLPVCSSLQSKVFYFIFYLIETVCYLIFQANNVFLLLKQCKKYKVSLLITEHNWGRQKR